MFLKIKGLDIRSTPGHRFSLNRPVGTYNLIHAVQVGFAEKITLTVYVHSEKISIFFLYFGVRLNILVS